MVITFVWNFFLLRRNVRLAKKRKKSIKYKKQWAHLSVQIFRNDVNYNLSYTIKILVDYHWCITDDSLADIFAFN